MRRKQKTCPAVQAQDRRRQKRKGNYIMPLCKFITILKGNQAEYERFCRIVEDAVLFYLLFAGLWTLCRVVGNILQVWGVA